MQVDLLLAALAAAATLAAAVQLVREYAHSSVSTPIKVTVALSWFLGFVGLALLPLDSAMVSGAVTASGPWLVPVWRGLYWVTFVLAWVVLPVLIEGEASGELQWSRKVWTGLRVTLVGYAWAAAAAAVVATWFLVTGRLSVGQLMATSVTAADAYGQALSALLGGYGLVLLPRFAARGGISTGGGGSGEGAAEGAAIEAWRAAEAWDAARAEFEQLRRDVYHARAAEEGHGGEVGELIEEAHRRAAVALGNLALPLLVAGVPEAAAWSPVLLALDASAGVCGEPCRAVGFAGVLAWVCLAVFCGLFSLSLFRSTTLYRGRLTGARALLFNAVYACRLQFSLGLQVLHLTGWHARGGGRSATALQTALGAAPGMAWVDATIPVIGSAIAAALALGLADLCLRAAGLPELAGSDSDNLRAGSLALRRGATAEAARSRAAASRAAAAAGRTPDREGDGDADSAPLLAAGREIDVVGPASPLQMGPLAVVAAGSSAPPLRGPGLLRQGTRLRI
ncbi:hypothetical protein FNF29_05130 [Cafeteria roenbergensis]|uniref:LMBR1-like membrane protein n=2 Tax=Cafeteria roenbergensis TaxID=33653 RepID=A0A5A8CM25_CAFRO|nr:hypothetical protein FNF29_05130 [Cafeteria roenbergensis]KAA0152891.1 hypothetical protein FNF28_06998 [Cafeteria roenbergensis]|eukprot:KAA0150555.1 hypothetical protein FNF29_05130 [Cafeteria roenbergensis]